MMTGKVVSVETRNLAEPAVADAAVAATTLYVNDASTFDENGGFVSVNGDLLVYLTTDVDANTITLAAGLATAIADQDSVEVYPPTPVKTALVSLGDDGGDSVPATVEHALLDKLTDGTRDDATAETVVLEQRGTYDLVAVDLVGEQLVQRSLDYVESEAGYGLDESVTQMQDARVLGELGAAGLSVDTLKVGGADFQDVLDSLPLGKLLEGRKSTGTGAGTIGTTEVACFLFNMGNLSASRSYRVTAQFHFQMTGTISAEQYSFNFRHTTDGTEATASSPFLPSTKSNHRVNFSANGDAHLSTPFEIASDAPVQVCLSAARAAGTTTGSIYQGGATGLPLIMSLYDDGPVGALSTTAIKQRLGLAEGVPVSTFTKTFNAIWANGIGLNGIPQHNTWMQVGLTDDYYSEGAYGLVGFDSTDIVSKLAGVVTPTKCVLRFRGRARRDSTGLDLRFLTHTYASLAASDIGFEY